MRRDQGERRERSVSVGNRHEAGSHQSGSRRHRDRSQEYANRESTSPNVERPRNATMDTMSRALQQAARSPFSRDIESTPTPSKFARPPFNSYTGKTDPVEHVSHYIQMMSLHSHNDALICKVFPSSLGPTALRWFNGLKKGLIHSFWELIQEFGVRFMTCSRVPQPVDALLSRKMGAGETLRNYSNRYWELYNEIGGGNEKIAASTFRIGLPEESGLRESLTLKPPEDMRQLMRRIEEYKRLEDDRLDKGHTTEQCRVLKDHLEQLVKAGHLKEFLVETGNQATGQADRLRRNSLPPPLGVIEVIHAAPRAIRAPTAKGGLGLKKGDLSKYDTPLMGFDENVVILEGQISLPVIMGGREVMVMFIVVASFSPYTAIFGRPWIHDMGAVPSTLHVKVKFRTDEGITVIRGDQQAAKQCLVAATVKQTEQKESTEKATL
ncbi:uncharacterized protein LOC142635334 [Castanea sativa]|uniref:uncharacterized protein LOC142635334 n=1 Tax=Castanea sativa TaxID=21020 RepID=UPI003F64C373